MNAEQLKEFIELCQHPAIKEKFDGWRVGDVANYNSFPGGLHLFHVDRERIDDINDEACTWIPPVHSHTDPERSLWAWAKPSKVYLDGGNFWLSFWPSNAEIYGATLPIALARAVIWCYEQEKEKGEK